MAEFLIERMERCTQLVEDFAMLALSENVFRCAKIEGVLCLTKY